MLYLLFASRHILTESREKDSKCILYYHLTYTGYFLFFQNIKNLENLSRVRHSILDAGTDQIGIDVSTSIILLVCIL